jgi:hypothetical protein
MGAGNGQWARAITERWYHRNNNNNARQQPSHNSYHVVLAYDDMSQLPLDPKVYHARTKAARDYFGTVRPLLLGSGGGGGASAEDGDDDALRCTLQQWQCRGRALLLVYPPPASDMAVQCARAYGQLVQADHTILYVGEGRGGATANDAFFDYLELSGDWWICQVLDVHPFGTKGHEKLYVLKKKKQQKSGK